MNKVIEIELNKIPTDPECCPFAVQHHYERSNVFTWDCKLNKGKCVISNEGKDCIVLGGE